MSISPQLKKAKDIIEFYGLQEDPQILTAFKMLSINQNSKDIYNMLMTKIHNNPEVKKKEATKSLFHTPPPSNSLIKGIRIGTDENERPYYLRIVNLIKHLLMAAQTGFCKTTLIKLIMKGSNKQGIRFISIDSKRDARSLMKEIPMLILRFNEKDEFKFNPLQPIPGVSRIEQLSLFTNILAQTTFLMDGSYEMIMGILSQLDEKKKCQITVPDLYQAILNTKTKDFRESNWRMSSKRAIGTIIRSFGNITNCAEGIPITALNNHNIVLELDGAGPYKNFWATLIPAYYLTWKISNNIRGNTVPLHLIFCDDGNLVLGKDIQRKAGMGTPTILSLIQTCREFGEGWIITTNEPCALAETAFVNTSTKIMGRNGNVNNTMAIARAIPISPTQAINTMQFEPGETVGNQEGQKHPCKIHLDYVEQTQQYPTDQEITENNKPILEQYPTTQTSNTSQEPQILENEICPECTAQLIIRNGSNGQFVGCTKFPKCRYTKSLSENDQPLTLSQEQKELLWHIHQNQDLSKTQHYKALGLSAGRANTMTKKIQSLIKEITIQTGQRGRQPIYLTLTKEALSILDIKEQSTRGSGIEHDFHANRYLRQLQKAGIKAQTSFSLQNKEADIGITQSNGNIIAVEISTTTTAEWELEQITKNFEAGFYQNITLLTYATKTEKLTHNATKELPSAILKKTIISQIIPDITNLIQKEMI